MKTQSEIDLVPDELWIIIFTYCDLATLINLFQAAKKFYSFSSDDKLWKQFILKTFGPSALINKNDIVLISETPRETFISLYQADRSSKLPGLKDLPGLKHYLAKIDELETKYKNFSAEEDVEIDFKQDFSDSEESYDEPESSDEDENDILSSEKSNTQQQYRLFSPKHQASADQDKSEPPTKKQHKM